MNQVKGIFDSFEGLDMKGFIENALSIDPDDGISCRDHARRKSFLRFGKEQTSHPILSFPTILFLLKDNPEIDGRAVVERVIRLRLDSHLPGVERVDLTVDCCFDSLSSPVAQAWVDTFGTLSQQYLRRRTVQKIDLPSMVRCTFVLHSIVVF